MASLETLIASVAAQPDVHAAVEHLVGDLAERIRATSNDQNIQRLARDLTHAAPELIRAVVSKVPVG